jgi:pyroglutamyl-peptidase
MEGLLMKALITSFEPFNGEPINPGYEVTQQLPKNIESCTIITAQLPTSFYSSIVTLETLLNEHQPELVICLGLAGGETEIRFEKVAINLNEARIPDNSGNQPCDESIEKDGPTAYFSNLPLKSMVTNLAQIGIPSHISYTAGTYVCNHIFYGLMHLIETEYPMIKGGFIHIPYLPAQVINKKNTPSMSLDTMVTAVINVIHSILNTEEDLQINMGNLD